MKFCPFCGAKVVHEQAKFCAECGQDLSANTNQQKDPDNVTVKEYKADETLRSPAAKDNVKGRKSLLKAMEQKRNLQVHATVPVRQVSSASYKALYNKLCEIIVEQLGVKYDDINIDSDFSGDLGADSLDRVELTMAIEEEFNVEIPDEVAEKIHTVRDAVNYLNNQKKMEENIPSSKHTEAKVRIRNKQGIHARPASSLVQIASRYKSTIQIKAKGKIVDAKSILMLMSINLTYNTDIIISADGYDSEEAVSRLVEFIESGCGEI